MTVYIAPNNRKVYPVDRDKYNDQVILTGTDESYLVDKGIFYIEFFEADTGKTVTIKDGSGNTIAAGVSSFSQDHSPIRCDYGIQVTGDLAMLKGYVMRNVFEA
jgi:hypothetical protein